MTRVLLVDDDDTIRSGLSAFLRILGHEVREASCSSEALAVAGEFPLDVVLTDLKMEGGSGIDLARRLTLSADPSPAVVLFTGYVDEDLERKAFSAGIIDILEKPVRPGKLREIIEKYETSRLLKMEAENQAQWKGSLLAGKRKEERRHLWGMEG